MLKINTSFRVWEAGGHALDDGEFSKMSAILSVNLAGDQAYLLQGKAVYGCVLCALMCKLQLVLNQFTSDPGVTLN